MLARLRTYEYGQFCGALEVKSTAHRRLREARLEARVIAL